MNQILHIFRKDARRFWAEILISLVITACFVCIGAYLWLDTDDQHGQVLGVLAALLAMLVPVSWWVLITRAIHAERLVGDTQFWITRPYTWKNLLGAKLLFLLVFLYLPFFIAQCLLLIEAGFPPYLYLAGLLFNLLLIGGAIVLPLTALATVTSSFARMTLTLLGIFVGFIAVAAIAAFASNNQPSAPSSHVGGNIGLAIALLGFAAAVVLQYALRRVWLARGVLLALPVFLAVILFAASKYDQAQMGRIYPVTQGAAPFQLAYDPDPHSTSTSGFAASARAMVPISFRMAETGVEEGYAIIPEAIRAQITAPDGSHWESEWQVIGSYRFLPGETFFTPGFSMPIAVYNRFRPTPLKVHLDFAVTQARAGRTTSLSLPAQRFSVPEFGVCSGQRGWAPLWGQMTGINCVSALNEPPLTYVSTRWSDAACSAAQGADPEVLGTAWVGSLDREPAQIGISPVVEAHVNLSNNVIVNTPGGKPRYLCPGTPITFKQYNAVRRTQTSVDIQGFTLPQVKVEGNQITITQ